MGRFSLLSASKIPDIKVPCVDEQYTPLATTVLQQIASIARGAGQCSIETTAVLTRLPKKMTKQADSQDSTPSDPDDDGGPTVDSVGDSRTATPEDTGLDKSAGADAIDDDFSNINLRETDQDDSQETTTTATQPDSTPSPEEQTEVPSTDPAGPTESPETEPTDSIDTDFGGISLGTQSHTDDTDQARSGASQPAYDPDPQQADSHSDPLSDDDSQTITEASTNGASSFGSQKPNTTSTTTAEPPRQSTTEPETTSTASLEATTSPATPSTSGTSDATTFDNPIDIQTPPAQQSRESRRLSLYVEQWLLQSGTRLAVAIKKTTSPLVHLTEAISNWAAIAGAILYVSSIMGAIVAPEQWPSTTGTGAAATQATLIDASVTVLPLIAGCVVTGMAIRRFSGSYRYADSTEPLQDV